MPEVVVVPVTPEVRASTTLVTSENRAEFMEKRLGLEPAKVEEVKVDVKEEKKEEVKVEVKAEEDELVKEEKDEGKKHKLNLRFSELTKQREDAKADAAKERESAAKERQARADVERERDELRLKLNPPVELGDKPQPAQYADVNEYSKALESWTEKKTKQDMAKEAETKAAQERQDKVFSTWKERIEATKKELPDYAEKIANAKVVVSDQVRDAILESDVGPQILYHFAENPEVAERIGKLTVGGALRELGRLEAKLEKVEKKEEKKEEKRAEISKAPPPISPLKGANSPAEIPMSAAGEFTGSPKEWRDLRKAGKIK